MKKWYKQSYFDRQMWVLENFDKLNLTHEETLLILLIDYAYKANVEINNNFLCEKLNIDSKALDVLLSSLVAKGYLNIKANKRGVSFNIDGLFEFDPDKFEQSESKSIYEMAENLIGKPLTPNDYMKLNDCIDKYGDNKVIDAIRMSEAYRKYNLNYVEGILKNDKK